MSALLARRNAKLATMGLSTIEIAPMRIVPMTFVNSPHQSPVFNIREFISWLYVQKAGVRWDRPESMQFIKNKCREKGFLNSDEEITNIFNSIHRMN